MSSAFGQYLKLSIFGQSHGEALGVTLDGFPAGMTIDMEQLLAEWRACAGAEPDDDRTQGAGCAGVLVRCAERADDGSADLRHHPQHESALEGLWRWCGFGASGSCGLHRACALLRL